MSLLKSLKTQPGYTLMRGPARFRLVRDTVSGYKRLVNRDESQRIEKTLLSSLNQSIFKDVDVERFTAELLVSGCGFGLKLPSDISQEIRTYAETTPAYAFRESQLGFYTNQRKDAEKKLGKEILLAQYFNAQKNCIAINKIANDPFLNLIALRYLGSVPNYLGSNLWWTYPVTPNRDQQIKYAHYFHRDIDDFKFLKFFFYLSDVGSGDGAHWVILGSHKKAPHITTKDFFFTRRFEDREVRSFYESKNIKEVVGAVGDGFAEDTLCVHKAATPTKNPRLILQFQFGLFNFVPECDERPEEILKLISY